MIELQNRLMFYFELFIALVQVKLTNVHVNIVYCCNVFSKVFDRCMV